MSSVSVHITNFWEQIPGEPVNHEHVFPIIESQNTRGQETIWELRVTIENNHGNTVRILRDYYDCGPMPDGYTARIKVYSGIRGKTIRNSSNVHVTHGKRNLNVFCQALRDALGKYNKKIRGTKKGNYIPPMLAQLTNRKIEYPVFIQRKYNGNRAIATMENNKVIMYSRGLRKWEGNQNIKDELYPLIAGTDIHIDGEIYKHGVALQDYGTARSNLGSSDFNFMIYDYFTPRELSMPYYERYDKLKQLIPKYAKYLEVVPTYKVSNKEEAREYFEQFLDEEYEGAIIRDYGAPYQPSYNSHKSKYLIKMKPIYDDEYKIVSYTQGSKGKAVGQIIFVCKLENGATFNSIPKLTEPERRELFAKMPQIEDNGKTHFCNHYYDQWLKVYYNEKSKNNIPQQSYNKVELRTPIDIS